MLPSRGALWSVEQLERASSLFPHSSPLAHLTAAVTPCQQRSRVATQRCVGGPCLTLYIPSSIWREQMGKVEGGLFVSCFLEAPTDLTLGSNTSQRSKLLVASVATRWTGWGTSCPAAGISGSFAPSSSPTSVNTNLTKNLSFGLAHCRLCVSCALTTE